MNARAAAGLALLAGVFGIIWLQASFHQFLHFFV
jgi:hypothetical protein